jgi:hypothetical protein
METYTKTQLSSFINSNKEIKKAIQLIKYFDGFTVIQENHKRNLLELVCNDYNLYCQIIEII